MKNSGKGHYNIYVREEEIYKQSKLYKLLKRIMLMICDEFRDLAEQSAAQYVEMIEKQALWSVDIPQSGEDGDISSLQRISSQHPDNPENSQIVYRQPLFSIQLGAVAIT